MATATQEYAQLFCGLKLADVPTGIVEKIKRHVLDMIGVMLVGITAPGIESVRDYALKYGSPGRSRLVGPGGNRLDPEFAALYNATAARTTEMDDHHVVSCHPGCTLVPAALAVAEDQDVSGAEFLRAMIASYEITTRVAMATTLSVVFDRGFHNACCYNGFGSAASTALMLGANEEQFVNALSLATCYASGAGGSGGMTRFFGAGIPAANGIRAGRLATMGLVGGPASIEGPGGRGGYLRAFSAHPKPGLLTQSLQDWIGIMGLRLKHTYCSTGNIAAQIEAFRSIIDEHSLGTQDIKAVHVGMDPLMLQTASGGAQLGTAAAIHEAHFSTPLHLAIAAVRGRNDFKTFVELSEQGFQDPEIQRIARTVTFSLDSECEAVFPELWMTKVTVTTTDGRSLEARGFAMTEPDVEAKFRELLEPLMPTTQVDALIDRVQSLDQLDHIDELTRLLELAPA
jgi:2-methylcitrate dehydratase PrpD